MKVSNEIAGANAGLRAWFFEKSRLVLSLWPGVAQLERSAERVYSIDSSTGVG
jgi:hypothetical protein